jgi:hypothetical protein
MMFPDLCDGQYQEYVKALRNRDKVLENERNNIHQSLVYDDQTDYHSIAENIWENEQVRTQAVNRIIDKFD